MGSARDPMMRASYPNVNAPVPVPSFSARQEPPSYITMRASVRGDPYSDARRHDVRNGDRVRVVSRRGAFVATARVSDTIRSGSVFAPFHWAFSWAPDSTPNLAASTALDPRSKQPELKYAAVKLEAL